MRQDVMQFTQQALSHAPALPVGVHADRADARNLDVLPTHTDHPTPEAELRHRPPLFHQPQMVFRLAALGSVWLKFQSQRMMQATCTAAKDWCPRFS